MLHQVCWENQSQVERRRLVVTRRPPRNQPLPVFLSDRNKHRPHHENHQPDGEQGRAQDVGDLPAVTGEVQAAHDGAAHQEAAAGGHEVDGEPEDLAPAGGRLGGPQGVAAGQGQRHAGRAAGGRQLILGLGEAALPQRDALREARHDLPGDRVHLCSGGENKRHTTTTRTPSIR